MIKFVIFAAILSTLCRWALGKWPWDYLKSPPKRARSIAEARRLLKVDRGATAPEIREAHRRMALLVHPDKGGTDAQLAQVNAARDTLLDDLPREGHDRT